MSNESQEPGLQELDDLRDAPLALLAERSRQHAEIESLRQQLANRVPDGLALKVLRDLEWTEVRHEYRESEWYCPVCDGDKRQGHAAGCELAAALSKAPAQPEQPAPRDHVTSPDCWCNPELNYVDPETGGAVYVHKEPQ